MMLSREVPVAIACVWLPRHLRTATRTMHACKHVLHIAIHWGQHCRPVAGPTCPDAVRPCLLVRPSARPRPPATASLSYYQERARASAGHHHPDPTVVLVLALLCSAPRGRRQWECKQVTCTCFQFHRAQWHACVDPRQLGWPAGPYGPAVLVHDS